MIQATVTNIMKQNEQIRVVAEFDDGHQESFIFSNIASADEVKQTIQARVDFFDSLDGAVQLLTQQLGSVVIKPTVK